MARFLFYDDKLINIMQQHEKPSGGASVQAYGWIMGLIEEGQEVYVLTDTGSKSPLKEECKNVNLVSMYNSRKGIRWLRWFYYRLPYTYKKIKAVNPGYFYLGIPGWTSLPVGLICRLLKIKLVHRLSNDNLLDERFYRKHSWVHRLCMYWGLRLSAHILCQNNYQFNTIKTKFPDKSVIKISNPLFLKTTEAVPGFQSRRYIAWLGFYRYPKNLKLLFEIASALPTEEFLIAGKESAKPDEETICYLEKLKKLPNVKFTGFLQREQVLPYLANARFLLNTSRYEGFSNTFLEAMSVGTPILSGKNVNPDSIISTWNLGIIYTDVNDLLKQYTEITPAIYQQLSKNAREYVTQHHGYRLLAGKLLRYLAEADNTIPVNKYGLRELDKYGI